MRLLCIFTGIVRGDRSTKPLVKCGDECTTDGLHKSLSDGEDCYFLHEDTRISRGNRAEYIASLFIPLDGPDETEYADKILDEMFQSAN